MTLLLSCIFMLGASIGSFGEDDADVEDLCVALAFGAMLAVAVFDMIPELVEAVRNGETSFAVVSVFTVLGIVLLLILDRFVPEHGEEGNLTHIGIMSSLAIVIHNIVEGMSVYSVCSTSLSSGILLSLGVGIHNIPMGMLIFSTTKKESLKRRIFIISIACLSTFFGGLIMTMLENLVSTSVVEILTSVAFGMVIYILFFELLGDILRSRKKPRTLLWIMMGLTVVIISGLFG